MPRHIATSPLIKSSNTSTTHGAPLNVQAKKVLKKEYYTKWDADKQLTVFRKCLNNDQQTLTHLDVTIADNDKLQFYLEEIYDSNCFDKQEMLMWEQQPAATKMD